MITQKAKYALRALTEPMWANDFVAIWGFKGKTFFAEGRVPGRLFLWKSLTFAHPEYPLGLPFLYAGIASLLGRWDDHAMARPIAATTGPASTGRTGGGSSRR